MMGFGSEDLQRNGGHYNPPGGNSYSSSDQISKPNESKWGQSSTQYQSYGATPSYGAPTLNYGGSYNGTGIVAPISNVWGPEQKKQEDKKPESDLFKGNKSNEKKKKKSSHKKKKRKQSSSESEASSSEESSEDEKQKKNDSKKVKD